jgi:hypothetical protein
VITGVNGMPVATVDELATHFASILHENEVARLTVRRGENVVELAGTLGHFYEDGGLQ